MRRLRKLLQLQARSQATKPRPSNSQQAVPRYPNLVQGRVWDLTWIHWHHEDLNLLKQEKTAQGGIKAKRLQCGWNEPCLLKVLGV